MNNFVIEKIKEISGRISFFKLSKNGVSEFDEFVKEIKNEHKYSAEILRIQIIMQQVSDLNMLPDNKFKELKGRKSNVKEYEIKTRNLRVYLFHEEHTGKIIVTGGKKTSQKKDIKHFRNLVNEYLESKKI